MADLDVQAGQGPAGNKERWADQGGGVYAKLVAAVLAAGSAVIGKVSIDQTTPGTTDSVTVATAQGAGAAIGATTGAAVVTDANGTIQQYLRGVIVFLVTAAGGAVANVASAAGFLRALGIRQYLATPPVLTDTRYQHGLVDGNGYDQTNLGTLLAGENQALDRLMTLPKYNYTYIPAGQTTTVIKAAAGVLHSVTFWAPATASNVTTFYDHPSTSSAAILGIPAAVSVVAPVTVLLDVAFVNGCTVITTTANGAPMLVAWL